MRGDADRDYATELLAIGNVHSGWVEDHTARCFVSDDANVDVVSAFLNQASVIECAADTPRNAMLPE